MKKIFFVPMLAIMLIQISSSMVYAKAEWQISQKIQLESRPLDVAVSLDNKWIFILNDKGEILIYSQDGTLNDTINVGKDIDGISIGPPRNNLLFLTSAKNKTVEVVQIDFIQTIDITGSPYKGPDDAPVVIVLFTDFQCPYCARLEPTLKQVLDLYPDKVKLVYKNFPLSMHQYAMKAAIAALAAEKQGKFWEFHDLLFENYNHLNDAKIKEIALELNLDEAKFETDLNDPTLESKIRKDQRDGTRADVGGTPTIFINGKVVRNRSLEGFKQMIDKALQSRNNMD